jgi:hypothetical protein
MEAHRTSSFVLSAILFFVLAMMAGCKSAEVKSFAWLDEKGSRLSFRSTVSNAESAGSFAKQGEKQRYVLARSIAIPDGFALSLRFAAQSSSIDFQVSYGGEKGTNASVLCSMPQTGLVAFILPFEQLKNLQWLEIKLQRFDVQKTATGEKQPASQNGPLPLLQLQEIRLVPQMRGFRKDADILEVSPQFSFHAGQSANRYEIRQPFSLANDTERLNQNAQLEIVLEGASGLATLFWGGQKMVYRRAAGESRLVIPFALFGREPAEVSLEIPANMQAKVFCADAYPKDNSPFALDPGLLLFHVPLTEQNYFLARWDLMPDVLLFLFKDYATQDRYLKRLAFFVEKIGFVGRLAPDSEIANLHGWNAHDYRPEDIARFFDAAASQHFPLAAEEIELRELLLKQGLLIKSGSRYLPGKGAFVSITQESPPYLQSKFLVHELSHALFFTDNRYRDLALSLYQNLNDDEKWFLIQYFRWMRYNIDSAYLMANEMQAYLVQQPTQDLEKYFSVTLGERLAQEHPELKQKIDSYMQNHLAALVRAASQLNSYLRTAYGFEAGRLFRVR